MYAYIKCMSKVHISKKLWPVNLIYKQVTKITKNIHGERHFNQWKYFQHYYACANN